MRSALRIAAMGVIVGAALTACGGDDHGGGGQTTPSAPTTLGFEPFAQQQVIHSSCETLTPQPTTGVSFVFAADQDTADPRDLSKVTPGCDK